MFTSKAPSMYRASYSSTISFKLIVGRWWTFVSLVAWTTGKCNNQNFQILPAYGVFLPSLLSAWKDLIVGTKVIEAVVSITSLNVSSLFWWRHSGFPQTHLNAFSHRIRRLKITSDCDISSWCTLNYSRLDLIKSFRKSCKHKRCAERGSRGGLTGTPLNSCLVSWMKSLWVQEHAPCHSISLPIKVCPI